MSKVKTRIAAMSDLHMQQGVSGIYKHHFEEISKKADILLLCGDLTDNGLLKEAELLAEELNSCKIQVIGILGNHDYTNNQDEEIKKMLSAKMFLLGEQPYTYQDIGFVGVKGFGGGFDKHLVTPLGENLFKQFVYEAVNETIKLEETLAKLETDKKIVILHYAPIRQTLEGEPLEVYPFLGTSRLIEPIENYHVSAVFHGHAHYGKIEGQTISGIPVYNVSFPLLLRNNPDQPFIVVEI